MANQGRFAAPVLSLVIAAPIIAQTPQPIAQSWAGWAQCQITIQAPGYSHRETHLWTVTGAGTKNANMEIYPTSWTVTGEGSLQRVNGPTMVSAQWTVNGTLQNVTIGTTLHLDRITVQRWTNHGPARSGLTGTEISTTNGVARSRSVVLDVQQWMFPAIETGTASTRATGSDSLPFDGLRGPMNPPSGAMGTAACTWDFARGGVSPSSPPPSAAPAQATPSSGAPVSGGAPTGSGGGTGATGTGGTTAGSAGGSGSPAGTVAGSGAGNGNTGSPGTASTTPPGGTGGNTAGVGSAGSGSPAGTTAGGSAGSGGADGGAAAPGGTASGGGSADLDVVVVSSDPASSQPVTSLPAAGVGRYTITVKNNGPGNVGGALFAVSASAGLTYPWSMNGVCPPPTSCPGFGMPLLQGGLTIPSLPAGASFQLTLSGGVNGAVGSNVGLTATVTPPAGITDPNPANNSASTTQAVVASPSSTPGGGGGGGGGASSGGATADGTGAGGGNSGGTTLPILSSSSPGGAPSSGGGAGAGGAGAGSGAGGGGVNFRAFTTSGVFVVPAGVTTIGVELWGAGGGGAAGADAFRGAFSGPNGGAGGGGGGSGAFLRTTLTVTPGGSYNVVIGAGGSAGGGNGGNSEVMQGSTVLASAAGGSGGTGPTGGAGGVSTPGASVIARNGLNGSNAGALPPQGGNCSGGPPCQVSQGGAPGGAGGGSINGSVAPVGATGGAGGNGGGASTFFITTSQSQNSFGTGGTGTPGAPGYVVITW